MLSYLKQLALESLVYGLSGIISRFLAIFLVPIYTRIFTPEDYGVMSLVTTTMGLVSIFVVLALDSSAERWYWDTEDTDDRKTTLASWAWCQIVVSLVFTALLFILSDWLGQELVHRSDGGVYFRLAAIALPLSVLGTVVTNWLRMQRRPWATMSFSLGTSLFNILLTILLVVILRWGLISVFLAQVATAVLSTAIAAVLLKDWVDPRKFQWLRLKVMLKYALPLIPAALAYWIVNLSGRYFVQFFSSTSEVGLYHVGSTVASVVALVTGAFQLAWGPFAMSIHKQPEAKRVYSNVLLAYLWITCFISTALALFAPEILRFLTTEAYVGASRVVGLLAFNYVLIGLSYIAAIGPIIVKTTKPYGLAVIIAAGLTIGLNFLLVPYWGKEGSALATLIAQAIVPIYVFYRSQKLYPIPYRFGPAAGIFALALLLMFIGQVWSFSNPFLETGLKALLVLLFFPALFVFGIMTPGQARRLMGRVNLRRLQIKGGLKAYVWHLWHLASRRTPC
jgi:O-antigen/teichoic acid export membrane protein